MKIMTLVACLLAISSCWAPLAVTQAADSKESIRVVEHVRMVTVKPSFEIRPVSESRLNVRDTVDVIENDYAVSTVKVHRDGSIDHSLSSKPQILETEMDIPVTSVDTSRTSISQERVEVPVYVEMEISWWQKTLIYGGAISTAILLSIIILTLIKKK